MLLVGAYSWCHKRAILGYRQRWLPASSKLVVVSHARCSSHRTRDHRWPCVQFNCSSCMEQFANCSAVFRVSGHFLTPPENWTVRAFLQLTLRLSNDFTAAWLTFTFPQLFAVAATLKSIDYNVAMTFILNNNNNNNNATRIPVSRSKGQRSGSPGPLMLTHMACHIFRMPRPTNFKLALRMEDDDPHQPQAPWPPRSKIKVARSRDQSERSWPNAVPVSLEADGGIRCRSNEAATLLVSYAFQHWI